MRCELDTSSKQRRVLSLPALGGVIGAGAVDVIYLAAIQQQGLMPGGRVPFVAAWIAVAASLAVVGALIQAAAKRAVLLAIGAAAMLTLAVPGAMSIGIPLLICALAVGLGAARAAEQVRLPRWLVLVAAIVLFAAMGMSLALGFSLTEG